MSKPLYDYMANLSSGRVLVVGDLMLDRYIYGAVDRISPEAPVPVLKVKQRSEMAGGAANVAGNVASLGTDVGLVGFVGEDVAGNALRDFAARFGVDGKGLVQRRECPTTIKTRLVAQNQQIMRMDEELVTKSSPEDRFLLLEKIKENLAGVDVLTLSDYGKGVLTNGIACEVISAARQAGCMVLVDPKGRDYTRYRGADIITPNLNELAEATGMPVHGDQAVVSACRSLIGHCGFKAVVATRGKEGLSVVTAETIEHIPTSAREVFDVSGAGDTVLATLSCALAGGVPLVEAARLANTAGGLVVGKIGTSRITRAELAAVLLRQEAGFDDSKIHLFEEASRRIAEWRGEGLKIGFTNGCFDLLHPGHISLLRQARQACDRLVVGLNSDDSVRKLKGPLRPVQNEIARATVLASLTSVDMVVIFHDDTPLRLIEAFRPDVLVKGADYRLDQVVGADVVVAAGGTVVLAMLSAGHSTSMTLEHLCRHADTGGAGSV